jgi:hypothetical protein
MWQADNDRYALWRLERQLLPGWIDRLIDSTTVADRTERTVPVLPAACRLAAAIRRWVSVLCSPVPAATIVRRAAE